EDPAAVGPDRDPAAGDRGGEDTGRVLDAEADPAAARGEEARDRVDERRLTAPVRPDDRHELPLPDGERDVPQRGRVAIRRLEALDLKHAPSPGSAPRRRGPAG